MAVLLVIMLTITSFLIAKYGIKRKETQEYIRANQIKEE